mgnify:CR=1 FL=1|jgi:hypothetical protein
MARCSKDMNLKAPRAVFSGESFLENIVAT